MSTRNAAFAFSGQRNEVFWLAFKTAALTLVTLGIYRFWAKTRIRKYFWSATQLDGDRFEYTGTGLEKFLGFLVAVVVLAVYLGIIQMILFYFGLSIFVEPTTPAQMVAQSLAFNITFLATLPLIYFAIYRARRYKLARTRWRSIRFGMEKGAWGYALRALGYVLLSILSLGLLVPLMTFRLEKYMADRTWFGDARVTQFGRWQELYGAYKHVLIGVAILALGIGVGIAADLPVLAGIGGMVGYVWVLIGGIIYYVRSFAYLTSHKEVQGGLSFVAQPRVGKIIKIYVVGGLIIGLIGAVVFGVVGAIAMTAFEPMVLNGTGFGIVGIALVVFYVAAILCFGALSMALILMPVIEHYLTTITVQNLDAVDAVGQRATDTGADAEGFADALDIGGAI